MWRVQNKEPHASVHNLCFASLHSPRHKCVVFWCFFNTLTAHLKLKVSEILLKEPSPCLCYTSSGLTQGNRVEKTNYLHQHTKYFPLRFSEPCILNVLLWLSERASTREIFYHFIIHWCTFPDLPPPTCLQLSSYRDPNMGHWRRAGRYVLSPPFHFTVILLFI